MTTKILTARRTPTLIRVWRSIGRPGTPLTCRWIEAPTPDQFDDIAEEIEGLWLRVA